MKVTIEGNVSTRGIESIEVEDHDRLADKATVVVNDSFGIAADSIRNGQEITIEMGWEGEFSNLFKGILHQPTSSTTSGARRMTLTALDFSMLMHRRAAPQAYPPGTLKSLITAIISKPEYSRIKPGQIEPDPNPQWQTISPTLIQPNLTDLQLLQTLAVRNRARAFVEYTKYPPDSRREDCYFFFVTEAAIASQRAGAVLRCCSGFHELTEFNLTRTMTSAAPYRPSAVIDPLSGQVVTVDPTADPPPAAATTSSDRETAADAAGAGDTYRQGMQSAASASTQPEDMILQMRAAGLPSDPDLARAMSQRDPTTIRGLSGRGVAVGNIHLRAKSRVTIKGIATYAEGDWYVRIAKHKVQNGSYTTELVVTQ